MAQIPYKQIRDCLDRLGIILNTIGISEFSITKENVANRVNYSLETREQHLDNLFDEFYNSIRDIHQKYCTET
ncbi:MAG TPA: hypothetical protein VN721_09090 [Flavipsychrobacter sp.]|nr:hypothetical protein [Flavipsychrobacter sp.]